MVLEEEEICYSDDMRVADASSLAAIMGNDDTLKRCIGIFGEAASELDSNPSAPGKWGRSRRGSSSPKNLFGLVLTPKAFF